jgi:hypothetical protein
MSGGNIFMRILNGGRIMSLKRWISAGLAVALCLSLLYGSVYASDEPAAEVVEETAQTAPEATFEQTEEEAPEQTEEEAPEQTWEAPISELEASFTLTLDGESALDNDDLFSQFLDEQMLDGVSVNYGAQTYSGDDLILYNYIKGEIQKIALGQRSSAVITVPDSYTAYLTGNWNDVQDRTKAFIGELLSTLLLDCPADLYWFDKTAGFSAPYKGYGSTQNASVGNLTIYLAVAQDYAGDQPYTTNSAKISSAIAAVENAKALAAQIHSAYDNDYDRLLAIRDAICERVTYNYSATAAGFPYGDPWQMIYVFDGDDTTNVVCEGYAKSAQYLCDLALDNVQCITVTGTMDGGNHMWNIVTINGQNYLMDLTTCDSGDHEDLRGWMFLVGADSGSALEGYQVTGSTPSNYLEQTIVYKYDKSTLASYGTASLTLGSTSYVPAPTVQTGDVNGDDILDLKDVASLFLYLNSQGDGSEAQAAWDVTGDDQVDLKDVTRLFQLVTGQIDSL